MSSGVVISGSGVWTPTPTITNEELCDSFNEFVQRFNRDNAAGIEDGSVTALAESSPEFIEKASGIVVRHVWEKDGILDPERMCPDIPNRADDELALQAEYAVNAANRALAKAGRHGEEIDLVIVSCSNLERQYPAIAMEVQNAIGARGWAFDATVGCSSATYPIQLATDSIRSGSANRALVINPELMCPQVNYRDRDSHFIFGDAAAALVLEKTVDTKNAGAFEVLSTRMMSKFSSNIRNNGGFVNRCDPDTRDAPDKLFYQQGRRVFKDVVPLASKFIAEHLEQQKLDAAGLDRLWLHQANANMNTLISKRLLGRAATEEEAPLILGKYANTASAGSIIAFDHYSDDLAPGALGVLCSFGAGYSIGSIIVRRLN